MTQELWIVCGPNGAGKTTLVHRFNKHDLPVVNPDVIAATLNDKSEQRKHLKAGRLAFKERRNLMMSKKSFILETTFSGKGGLALIHDAKKEGYKVNLAFVALETPILSQMRVSSRVLSGGHAVPTTDVLRRFNRVYMNVKEALPLCDRAFIVDNSNRAPALVAKLKKGKVVRKYPTLAPWLKQRFPALRHSRKHMLGI